MFGRKDDPEEKPARRGGGFLGFLAFLVTIFAAVLYLIALILDFINVSIPTVIDTMRSVASMITMRIVGMLGWKFVVQGAVYIADTDRSGVRCHAHRFGHCPQIKP